MIAYYKIQRHTWRHSVSVECILRDDGVDRLVSCSCECSYELVEFALQEFLKGHEIREGFGEIEALIGKPPHDGDLTNKFLSFLISVEQRANDQEIERQAEKM